jgi:hypothetical protein
VNHPYKRDSEKPFRILEILILEGPLNGHQIEKRLELKHSTLADIISKLEAGGEIAVSSTSKFRTGLLVKNYRVTCAGFFFVIRTLPRPGRGVEDYDSSKLLPRLYPTDPLWSKMEFLMEKRGYVWPWLSARYRHHLKYENLDDLARAMVLLGSNVLVDYNYRLTKYGISENWGMPPNKCPRFYRSLMGFFLRVLFPYVSDDGALGMSDSATYYEIFFPELRTKDDYRDMSLEVFEKIPAAKRKAINLLAEQVQKFLQRDLELSRGFQEHIRWAAKNIDALSVQLGSMMRERRTASKDDRR